MAKTTSGDIFAAIKAVWDGSGLLTGIAGPFRDEAPPPPNPPATVPYAIFRSNANTRHTTTNRSEYWIHHWSIDVYDHTADAADAAIGNIGGVFDAAPLSAYSLGSGKGEIISTRRISEEAGQGDKDMKKSTLTYEFQRRKDRVDAD